MRLQDYIKNYNVLPLESILAAHKDREHIVLEAIGRGLRVLDLGCLGGEFSSKIQDQDNLVSGIEINPEAANLARSRGIDVRVHDLNEGIPYPDATFDVIHAGGVLERIWDTHHLLEECNRVLRTNGLLIFTVPNLNSLENRLRVLAGASIDSAGAFPEDHGGERIRVFNMSKIHELCERTGFKIEETVGLSSAEEPRRVREKLARGISRAIPQLAPAMLVKARRT